MEGNIKKTDYDNSGILLGDNEFETGIVSVPAGGEITEGAFLKRDTNGKFTGFGDTESETVAALFVGEKISNGGAAATDYPTRVLTGGKVRADKCHIKGTAATAAQFDMLRKTGIVPVKVTEMGMKDN